MNIFIKLKALEEMAKQRPPEYMADMIAHGIKHNDNLEMTEAVYRQMLAKYRPKIKGLGSLIAIPAQMVAKTIDKVSGGRTHISTCGGCQKRKEKLDKMFPL